MFGCIETFMTKLIHCVIFYSAGLLSSFLSG